MTTTLLTFTLNGRPFAVPGDDVASVVRTPQLHHLPLSPACVAGMALIDDRGTTIIDTAVCVGIGPRAAAGQGSLILLGDGAKRNGYWVEGTVETLAVGEDRVLGLPEMLRTEIIGSCAVHDGKIIPVIDITRLQERISSGLIDLPAPASPGRGAAGPHAKGPVRVFSLGTERFCLRGTGSSFVPAVDGQICELPHARDRAAGVLYHGQALVPVLQPAARLGEASYPVAGVVLAENNGTMIGIPVTEDLGLCEEDRFRILPLPAIAQNRFLREAAFCDGMVIPCLEISELFDQEALQQALPEIAERYHPASTFGSRFRKESVAVTEVALFSGRHGLPQDEVLAVLPFEMPRRIPRSPEIVLGVAVREEKVLPVLDLAAIFGRRSPVNDRWKMLHVANGDFEALVAVEEMYGEKDLPPSVQRQVPIVLPYDVVYGCYLDDAAVRLIANVESIAVHFEKTELRELMETMTPREAGTPRGDAATGSAGAPLRGSAGASKEADAALLATPAAAEEREPAVVKSPAMPELHRIAPEMPVGHFPQGAAVARRDGERKQKEKERAERAEQERNAAGEARAAEEQLRKKQEEDARSKAEQELKLKEETARAEQEKREKARAAEMEARRRIELEQAEQERRREEELRQEERRKAEAYRMQQEADRARTAAAEPERAATDRPLRPGTVHTGSAPDAPGRDRPAEAPVASSKGLKGLFAAAAIAAVVLLLFLLRPDEGTQKSRIVDQRERPAAPVAAVKEEPKKEPEPPLVLTVPKAVPLPEAQVYVVVRGDTLWSISKRFTGSPFNYPRVARDNSIATPDLIFPGQKIRLQKE